MSNRLKHPVKHTAEREHVADMCVKRVQRKGSDGGQKRRGKKKRGEGAEPWNVGTVAVNSISDCLGG